MPGLDSKKPIKVGENVVSRRRLARLVGVTPCYIGLIFAGKRVPSSELLNKIALVFDIPMDDLWSLLQSLREPSESVE